MNILKHKILFTGGLFLLFATHPAYSLAVGTGTAAPSGFSGLFSKIADSVPETATNAKNDIGNFFEVFKSKVFNPPNEKVNNITPGSPNAQPLPPILNVPYSSANAPKFSIFSQPSRPTQNPTASPSAASWTEQLKKTISDKYSDSDKAEDPDLKSTLELEQQYAGYSSKAVTEYAGSDKGKLDELVNSIKSKAARENGTDESPYYIEPNQFRKICDQNTYVLYSRVGGAANRDMRNPIQTGGPPTGEQSIWKVPTCSELAACGCCINTCSNVVLRKVGNTYVPICLPNLGFGKLGCTPMCKSPIALGACGGYTGAVHGFTGDRDCMGRPAGCEGSSDGCRIIIRDPYGTQFEYTDSADSNRYVKSKKGDNVVPPGCRIRKLNNNSSLPQGWVGQLDPGTGQCCKCLQR